MYNERIKDVEGIPFIERKIPFVNIFTPTTLTSTTSKNEFLIDSTTFLTEILSSDKKILIKSNTGSGKSFHIQRLLFLYATEDYLDDYLIFGLNSSETKEAEEIVDSIINQLFSNIQNKQNLRKKLERLFSSSNDEIKGKILFFFDVADDFNVKNSAIYNIIHSKHCFFPMIVWISSEKFFEFSEYYHHIYDIHGFQEDQLFDFTKKVIAYIGNSSTGEKHLTLNNYDEFKLFVNSLKRIYGMYKYCSNPSIALIVIAMWIKNFQNISDLSSTCNGIIDFIWNRKDLGKKNYNKDILLSYCSRKAFERLAYDKPIIYDSILKKYDYFGCMFKRVRKFLDPDSKEIMEELTFTHRILKDYFSARFILENQDSFLNENSRGYFQFSEKNIHKFSNSLQMLKSLNFDFYTKLCSLNTTILKNNKHFTENLNDLLKNGFSEKIHQVKLSKTYLKVILLKLNSNLSKLCFF